MSKRPNNAREILSAVVEYREACAAIQPTWDAFARHYSEIPPESVARRQTRQTYMDAQSRVVTARKRLLEAALDGRAEVPL
jgi:hypothetical protein